MRLKPLTVGPIVGHTTAKSVRLWGRGDAAMGLDGKPQRCFGVARITKANGSEFQTPKIFKLKPHFDFTGIVEFDNLKQASAYRYQVGYFNAELEPDAIHVPLHVERTWAETSRGEFRTPPSKAAAPVSFVFGSCRYLLRMFGGTFFDERGDKTFRSIMNQVRKPRATDFVLMVGDQIYADDLKWIGPDECLDEFNKRYRISFGQPNIRDMMSHVPTYMILDDHEIEDNWSQDRVLAGEYNLYAAAMQSYHSYQLIHGPSYVPSGQAEMTDTPECLWYSYQVGSAKVFVMDTRTERFREPREFRRMIGPEQMSALKKWLTKKDDEKVVKFIVSSVPLFPEFIPDPKDKWTGYSDQRNEILEHIRTNGVRRVVFLGGDVHCSLNAQLVHDDDPDFRVTSVVSSSFFWPYPQGRRSDFRMRGPLDESAAKYKITNPSKVISTDNFTRVSYDPGGTKPKLKVEIFGRKGKPLQGTTLEL